MTKLNIHIYPNNILNESRIFKQTKSIIKSTSITDIIIIGIHDNKLLEWENLDEFINIKRIKLLMNNFKKSKIVDIFKMIEFYIKILILFLNRKPAFVNCHSLSVLPIAPFFKIFSNSQIIYDAHELETHKTGYNKYMRMCLSIIQKILMRFTDNIIVISNSVKQFYQKSFPNKNISIVRNIPEYKPHKINNDYLRNKFKIDIDDIIFIYQGIISEKRMSRVLLDVFSKVNKNKHIVFMGFGDDTDLVKETSNLNSNIHYHEAVSQTEIINVTSSADVGLSLITNDSLNHDYCLPNKVFEYIHSGIPILSSNCTELSNLIISNNFGWITNPNFNEILDHISSINIDEVNTIKREISLKKHKYDWKNEEYEYLKFYNQ